MGLLSKMGEKATQDWAKNLTPEQIAEYERQGLDMSEYKIIAEEHRAEQQRIADSIDLSMLDIYKTVRDDEFLNEVAKFNKLSDKKKPKLETASLVYGRVVQAHSALFKSVAAVSYFFMPLTKRTATTKSGLPKLQTAFWK